MIELKNVVRVYNNYGGGKVTALKGINLKLADTGLVCVAGPSGGGKTTLLNIISGVDVPTSGEMFVNGVSTEKFDAKGFDGYRNSFVGVIHQDLYLLDHLTLGQNVALALEIKGATPSASEISELFTKLGIKGMEDRYPNQCSIGQCQRVAIARTLIKKPKILIADEPTSSIDPDTRIEIFGLLKELSKEILIVASTHTREMIERFADRILMINEGSITSDTLTGGVNSNAAIYDQGRVIAVEPGTVLSASDIDKVNDAIRRNNKKGVYLCMETEVSKISASAARELQASIRTKQKVKEKNKQEKLEQLQSTESGVFQFEKTALPFKSALRLSLVNFTSNKLRSIFTVVLSFLAIMFFALTSSIARVDLNGLIIDTFADGKDSYITFGTDAKMFNKTGLFGDEEHGWINTLERSELVYDIGRETITNAVTACVVATCPLALEHAHDIAPLPPCVMEIGEILGMQKVVFDESDTNAKNKFGMELVAGRWLNSMPTDNDKIIISDFMATQIQTAAYRFALDSGIPALGGPPGFGGFVPTFSELVNLSNPNGWNAIQVNGELLYIAGIYKTDFSDYFVFAPGVTMAQHGREVFRAFPDEEQPFHPEQMRIRSDLSRNQRLRAEYLLQNDFVTGFVNHHFIEALGKGNFTFNNEGDYFITDHRFYADSGFLFDEIKKGVTFQAHIDTPGAPSGNEIKVSQDFFDDVLKGSSVWKPTIARLIQSYSVLPDWSEEGVANVLDFGQPSHSFHLLREFDFVVEVDVSLDDYTVLLSQTALRELRQALFMPATSFIVAGDYNAGTLRNLFNAMNTGGEVTPRFADSAAITEYAGSFDSLSGVMITAAIALAIFVIALMYNYIFQSIRSKRKSIAVIRSMGARTVDVFKIFVLEAGILAGLICIGAFITVGIAAGIGNLLVQGGAGLQLAVFTSILNPGAVFLMALFTLAVIFASYMLPVFAYARHSTGKGLVKNINVKSDN